MPGMMQSSLRIARPAVREGWLLKRERSDRTARGRDRFVEVNWDLALELVSDELARVRERYGHAAIFGGSYGGPPAPCADSDAPLSQQFRRLRQSNGKLQLGGPRNSCCLMSLALMPPSLAA